MTVDLKGLTDNARKTSVEELGVLMADASALALAVKQAHWNMKGSNFIAVHELMDDVHGHLMNSVDDMAERIQQLDGVAKGTVEAIASAQTLPPFPTDLSRIEDLLRELTQRLSQHGGRMREAIDTLAGAGDAASSDLLTEHARVLDKDQWFIASHLG